MLDLKLTLGLLGLLTPVDQAPVPGAKAPEFRLAIPLDAAPTPSPVPRGPLQNLLLKGTGREPAPPGTKAVPVPPGSPDYEVIITVPGEPRLFPAGPDER